MIGNGKAAFPANTFATAILIVMVAHSAINAQPPKKNEIPPVICGKVVVSSESEQQSFVGSVEVIRRSAVGAAVDGRVQEVQFDSGDPVGGETDSVGQEGFIGQPLVQLRTNTIDIELETARLRSLQLEQALEELQTSLPRDIELAESTLAGAKAQAEYSITNFQRLQKMSGNRGAISATELEEARSIYTSNSEAVKGAEADYQKLVSTKEIRLRQAENLLLTSRQEIARLEDLKSKYTIRTPFEGFVTQKSTEVGAWVTRGEVLFEVVQMDPIELIVNVPQKYVGEIQKSLAAENPPKAQLTFDSVQEVLQGTVVRVVPQADIQSRSFPVRIRVENPKIGDSHLLNPGMLGRASLTVGNPVELRMVKKDALVLGGRTPRVFKIVQQDSKSIAVSVDVKTGKAVGSWIEVSGELNSGDTIVTEGNERLRPGQEVNVLDTIIESIE